MIFKYEYRMRVQKMDHSQNLNKSAGYALIKLILNLVKIRQFHTCVTQKREEHKIEMADPKLRLSKGNLKHNHE